MPAANCAAVAGVPMNVRLPPLKNSGDAPVLVSWVGAAVVPGRQRHHAVRLEVGAFTRLPAADGDRPAALVGEPVNVAGAAEPAAHGQGAAVGEVDERRRPGLGQDGRAERRHAGQGGAAGQGERARAAEEAAVDRRPVQGERHPGRGLQRAAEEVERPGGGRGRRVPQRPAGWTVTVAAPRLASAVTSSRPPATVMPPGYWFDPLARTSTSRAGLDKRALADDRAGDRQRRGGVEDVQRAAGLAERRTACSGSRSARHRRAGRRRA